MPDDLRIEYPSSGATYDRNEYGVYRYSVYPESSVLAGQERRQFIDSYASLTGAQRAYPNAVYQGEGSGYQAPRIPDAAPAWFDPTIAGESWDGE